MKHRKQAWGAGLALTALVVAVACTPELRELGDAAEAGAGGDSSDNGAGSGNVLPQGGKATGGGGAAQNVAGAAQNDAGAPMLPEPCFSPGNFDLTREGGLGCPCNATDSVCVTELYDGTRWYGEFQCTDGRWKSVPPSCDEDCFSPTNSPQLAIDTPEAGCACNNEPAECVRTTYQGRDWNVGLECVDGRWQSVEDGVCGDGRQAACRVDGVTYPHGARNVPSPFDECNHCSCGDGQLVDCTIIECGSIECGEGSFQARRCVECGPADACLEVETGCLSGPGCESGVCDEGRCG